MVKSLLNPYFPMGFQQLLPTKTWQAVPGTSFPMLSYDHPKIRSCTSCGKVGHLRSRWEDDGNFPKWAPIDGLYIIEGSLEVKLPTIWTDEKQSRAEAERRGRLEERRSEEKE